MKQEPIRVLHVIGGMNRGGAETMIMNLYRNIDKSKVQFDFAVHTEQKCTYDDEIIALGGRIYTFPRFKGSNIRTYKIAWKRFFKENEEYKIVHGHIGSSAAIYLQIANKFGKHTIAHSHSTGKIQNLQDILWNLVSFPTRFIADYLFACSYLAGVKRFGNRFKRSNNKYIFPNAIESEKYIFSPRCRNLIRGKFNFDNHVVYGHVGRFTAAKNHIFLIEIFEELHRRDPNSKLLLVGDGELREEIEKKINDLGLIKDVIITGFVDNVHEYLQAIDIFLFPSIYEGLPTTVIEAQASGLQCFVSNSITNEVAITKLVKQLPINLPPIEWANIITNTEITTRINMETVIKKAGYNVETTAEWLEDFYFSKV